jgi:L-rhamnose isomerase/sugar isomerase
VWVGVRYFGFANVLGLLFDASHNVKDPLEDLLQSVEAIKIAYAQALLIDTKELKEAQENNDTAAAQEILQQAYRTDVRPLVAEARLKENAALQPLQLFRDLKVRDQLIKERGQTTVATGL